MFTSPSVFRVLVSRLIHFSGVSLEWNANNNNYGHIVTHGSHRDAPCAANTALRCTVSST